MTLQEVKDVAFATVDESGMPQVRIIDVMIIEAEKLYFCTARGKDFYQQLSKNPNIAITAMNKEYQMVRLNGKAQRLEDQKYWINRIFEDFDLCKEPIVRENFAMGDGKVREAGFEITKGCIQCGRCERVCPQKCIKDYEITQRNCLHCGLCK